MNARALLVAIAIVGCGDSPTSPNQSQPLEVHLGEVVDGQGEGSITLDVPLDDAGADVAIHLDGQARVVEIDAGGVTASLDGVPGQAHAEGTWHRPAPHADGTLVLALDGQAGQAPAEARVTIHARGAPVPSVDRERALVWIEPAIVEDPSLVGLSRVLAAASDDGHGGVLLDRWFRRFATTAHSERAAPAQLMDELAAALGEPSSWDLDALPFAVTAVHNRHDLAAGGEGCGELRVSFASTHDIYAPMHLIFLFQQLPAADDLGPDGVLHCLGNARRWARLSTLSDAAFVSAAGAILDEGLTHERFLLAETVELTVSPWEWRQWVSVGVDELDNPPLFQTVATTALNQPGALRDDFLAWVADNADALDARRLVIPASYRAASAQVPPSAPREELDLSGLQPSVADAYPELTRSIEIVGCPRCHTDAANFVHTTPQRTFSDFYDRELDARASRLDALNAGEVVDAPPFGPLQSLEP
jgi:hypothetical protein